MDIARKPARDLAVACLACLAPLSFAAAQDALPPAVVACHGIDDDPARLACYDRATARKATNLRRTDRAPEPWPGSVKPVEPSPAAGTQAERPMAKPRTDNAAARPAGNARPPEPEAEPEPYRAEVADIRTKPRGELVITLDSGETWEEISPSRYFPLEPGDTVELKTGLFGSWRMVSPAGRATRVRRVE